MPDAETLARLKREKLRLKEEMERLRGAASPLRISAADMH
jgi:hypothetical protein